MVKATKNKKKQSNKRDNLTEPNQSQQFSFLEITEKANFYWKEIDKTIDWKTYKEAWDGFDKYNKLKLNYKK